MKIDDKVRDTFKARINSIKNFQNRPYGEKEKKTDIGVLNFHLYSSYRDAVSYFIEKMVKQRLQRYED